MKTNSALKTTPLYEEHLSLKARIIPFGGWKMPIQYEGIMSEYQHTRTNASLFDTSHMGEFIVNGECVKNGLDHLITCSIKDMPIRTCRYGTLLNDDGGIIDDLIVFRLDDNEWMIVVNGATIEKDESRFVKNLTKDADFKNVSQKTGKLDLQGPMSRNILESIIPGIERLEYYTFDFFNVLGEQCIVSRTGYTGELGYEIYYPWEKIKELWRKLLENDKVKPAGLGARDVLRLEMGYSLYGQDLDETISPLEAGLVKFVDFNKDFLGKDALLKQKEAGVKRKMIFFASLGRRSPRHNNKIYLEDSKEIGIVTSGTFSPALKVGIGMGLVSSEHNIKDKTIIIGDEENKLEARVTGRTFYKNGTLHK